MADFIDPTTLTPLFITQQTVCAYPVSDFYGPSPRYLYYALLLACFVTQWTGWLANVFLGGAAAYAGVAAIEAMILRSHTPKIRHGENIQIPVVSNPLNSTFQAFKALVTDQDTVNIQPAALELDIDPILAIVVTGFLIVLPMQCWSRVVKFNRARHLLITLWNILMFAGTICALTLWPDLYFMPTQYKFCYPDYPDPASINNDQWPSDVWRGSWNATTWNLFSNLMEAEQLSDNCFYPCFNTTQILRKSTSLTATDYDPSHTPRLNFLDLEYRSHWISVLPNLIYLTIGLSIACLVFILVIPRVGKLSRVPIQEPRLLWRGRKELFHLLFSDLKSGSLALMFAIQHPRQACKHTKSTSHKSKVAKSLKFLRFGLDVLAILVLIISMILSPFTIIAFIVWIEWYIRHDGHTGESVQQVGQWSTYVSVALVLVSAIIYRLKYVIASKEDIKQEIGDLRERMQKLEALLEKKEGVVQQV